MLSAERDLNCLLDNILTSVMELARCDAGTLYLLDRDVLRFQISRNNTLKMYTGRDGAASSLPPVPLHRENVCALALLESRTIRIPNVYTSRACDFSGAARYDAITGYHTQSMLVVPMRSREGEPLGVLQLINAVDRNGAVCPFSRNMVLVLESIASQAAIAIQTTNYIREIKNLSQSIVRVMSSAIDERTPYNGSHTRSMARYAVRFLDFLNSRARARGEEEPFPPQRRDELLMSVWLHDVGKLTIPLEVMNKEARLLPTQHADFLHRMEVIRLLGKIDQLSGRITSAQLEALEQDTRQAQALVESVNTAGLLPEEALPSIQALAGRTYRDENGAEQPWLTAAEQNMLSIRKGTLSGEERTVMESHVQVTEKLLGQISFSKDLSHVKEWSSAHHEYLNGTGYPRGLKGDQIPTEARIITILDIFDALTADDRPYKPGMSAGRALSILDDMANREGKLDPALVALFTESRCWEHPAQDGA